MRTRPLKRFQTSGRWARGSHWPKSSRKENTRSFGPRPLLVAARAAERGVEAMVLDRLQQHRRLQAVARRALLLDAARVDRLLHRGDDQPLVDLLDQAVAELEHLGEVVAGVDVEDRERERTGPERLDGQLEQDQRVLASGEQQHGPLELGGDLAHDVDRLGLEAVELGDAHAATSPRARSAQREERSSPCRRKGGSGIAAGPTPRWSSTEPVTPAVSSASSS